VVARFDGGTMSSADRALTRPPSVNSRAGYRLRNVRDRLRGYFGDTAGLSIGRDSGCGMTVVSIEMPPTAPAAKAATP
jgi:sensor histidine kinase YesM